MGPGFRRDDRQKNDRLVGAPLDMGSIARFRRPYWMTMRGGWRRASPSVSDTFCQTRVAIAW